MSPLIENPNELVSFFSRLSGASYMQKKTIEEGVLVTSKVRKDFMCSDHQGFIIVDGKHLKIFFKNMQGGVWLAQLKKNI